MNIKQKRFIKLLLREHLSLKYRIARDRMIFGIVATVILLNVFNYFITNPLNVDLSTDEKTKLLVK